MTNYRDVLSEEKIQKILTKLQELNADFISFEDFVFGYSIVSFKQIDGDVFCSGSILIDENANIVPIKTECFRTRGGEQYDGFESVRINTLGSSLMKIIRVFDKDGNPTEYIQYSITIFRKERNGGRSSKMTNGIYNTKMHQSVNIFDSNMLNVHATLLLSKSILVNYIDKDDKKNRFGILNEKSSNGWLIYPGFSFIEFKDGDIHTYDENDIKTGTFQIYRKELEKYELCPKGSFVQIKGCVIRHSEQLIRNGGYAGMKFSDIPNKEYYIQKYAFLTDGAIKNYSESLKAYRDSVVILEPVLIEDKKQVINFKLPNYEDVNGNRLDISAYADGMSFEDAYIHHYNYTDYLIKTKKIVVETKVFTSMLDEDYASMESNTYLRDLIISSRDDINNVLSSAQIKDILDYINDKYIEDEELHELDLHFQGEACVVDFHTWGGENSAILLNRKGEIIDHDFSFLRIFDDNTIIYQIDQENCIVNMNNKEYGKTYITVKEQGIINSNGEILCKGDFGIISKIQKDGDYLILTKNKFTKIERDKLKYYLDHNQQEITSIDFDDEEDDEEYDEEYEVYVDPLKLRLFLCDNYFEALNSSIVSDGQFIECISKNRISPDEDDCSEWDEYEDNDSYDQYDLDQKLFSVYSIAKKKTIVPFQPCKVIVNPAGRENGIYLSNEPGSLESEKLEIKYEEVIKCGFSSDLGDEDNWFFGEYFHSALDVFRVGRFVGKTLSYVFKNYPKELNKLLFSGCIFIESYALRQLEQIYGKSHRKSLNKLYIYRDMWFIFDDICYSDDKIVGHSFLHTKLAWIWSKSPARVESFYSELPIKKVFDINPAYVIILIKNRIINVELDVLNGMDEKSKHYKLLKEVVIENVESQEREYQERLDKESYALEEEERRYYQNEGYRDAFDGDPEAQWNID